MRSSSFMMFISAAIFAYFGFALGWPQYTNTVPPRLVMMVVVLKWTMRGSAIAFAVAGLVNLRLPVLGNAIYAVTGLLSALLFVGIAIWDWSSPAYSGVHPFLLVLFGLWNGYGSWEGLRALRAEADRGTREAMGIRE